MVHSLTDLFFDTTLRLNINGFLSPGVLKRRGLRQGDPISSVLLNLAFEPLLRRILQDTHFNNFAFLRSPLSLPDDFDLQAVKLIAYADDVVCLLRDPSDISRFNTHLIIYSLTSNANINFHKTVIISLAPTCPLLPHYEVLF